MGDEIWWKIAIASLGDGDSRTKDLFLMESLWYPIHILAFFLIIVYFLGPFYMSQCPEPYDVYDYLVLHNMFLVIMNLGFGITFLIYMFITDHHLFCQPVGMRDSKDNFIAYTFYALLYLKLFELIDALILVAKKQEPPFILVFHHTTIVIVVWITVKYGPGGSAVFPSMLNCFVHVLVYLHFKYSNQFMNKTQTKRTFILIYFVQFTFIAVLSLTTIYNKCGFPVWLAFVSLAYNMLLLLVYSRTMWDLWCGNIPDGDEDSDISSDDGGDECDCHHDHYDGDDSVDSSYKIDRSQNNNNNHNSSSSRITTNVLSSDRNNNNNNRQVRYRIRTAGNTIF